MTQAGDLGEQTVPAEVFLGAIHRFDDTVRVQIETVARLERQRMAVERGVFDHADRESRTFDHDRLTIPRQQHRRLMPRHDVVESPRRGVDDAVRQREVLPRPLHRELPVQALGDERRRHHNGGRAALLSEQRALASGRQQVCQRERQQRGANAVPADVEQVQAQAVAGKRHNPHAVARQIIAGMEGVRHAQRPDLRLGRRQQGLLHARRQPQVPLQRFLRSPQAVFGAPTCRHVGLNADEVRHRPG